MNKNYNLLNTTYTILVILFPILFRYASPIPFLTLSEFLLLAFIIISLPVWINKTKVNWVLMFFCLYLVLHVLIALFSSRFSYDAFGTSLRLLFLYASTMVLNKIFFDFHKGKKIINVVSIVVSGYAIFQIIFIQYGIVLSTYLPFLQIMNSSTSTDVIVSNNYSYGLVFRPCSVLNEPAHLASYLALPLALNVFSSKKPRYWLVIALFLTITCFLSLSSTGIIISILIWLIHFFFNGHEKNKIAIGIVSMLVALFVLQTSGILDYFIARTFAGKHLSGLIDSTRFYALSKIIEPGRSIKDIVLGAGLQNTNDYLPSFARFYYCLGIIGFVFFIVFVYIFLKNKNVELKKIGFLYVVLNMGTEIMFGNFALYYMGFLLADTNLYSYDVLFNDRFAAYSNGEKNLNVSK